MVLQIILLIISIIALYYGAEHTLENAEKIGLYLGFSPLVIGLVIVGFGTSLPEFFVSQLACFRGDPQMALGNIIGSNIANIYLIMGLTGLFSTLHVLSESIVKQFRFYLLLALTVVGLYYRERFDILSGGILGGFFVYFLYHTFKQMRKDHKLRQLEEEDFDKPSFKNFFLLLTGFVLLYGGGELLVYSGENIGALVGISTYVISAIFVAFGTSFPELMTSVMAIRKGKNTDIITGNLVGSNIFNFAFVLGSLGVYNFELGEKKHVELAVLIFCALYLVGLQVLKKNFGKLSGAFFLAIYLGMIGFWLQK